MSDRFDFSGDVTFDRMHGLAGVEGDRICMGTLNRNVKAADFSMRFKEI